MNIELNKLSNDDLKAILFTLDGRGKAVKEEALDILIDRAIEQGI